MYTLSLICQQKNEAINLKEFIEHYKWQGVEHIYLIDNGSTDNFKDILGECGDYVTLFDRPTAHKQEQNYNEIFNSTIKNESKWLIVLDLDEFMFTTSVSNIKEYLKDKDKYSCIYVGGYNFGSRDEYEHPSSVREAFIRREPSVSGVKGIVQCRFTHHLGIHHHQHSPTTKPLYDETNIKFNHYVIQSKEYFYKVKRTRGDAINARTDKLRDDTYFNDFDRREVEDTTLRDLIKGGMDSSDNLSTFILSNLDYDFIVSDSFFKIMNRNMIFLLIIIILLNFFAFLY
jgi:hypothetical protein